MAPGRRGGRSDGTPTAGKAHALCWCPGIQERSGRPRRALGSPNTRESAAAASRSTPLADKRSDLDARLHGAGDLLDGLVDGDSVALLAAAVTERDGPRGDVVIARQQHVRHLLPLSGPDLLLHPVSTGVDLDPDTTLAQPGRNVL